MSCCGIDDNCTCNRCEGVRMSQFAELDRAAAGILLVTSTNKLLSVASIKQYLALSQTDATMAKFSTSTNTGALTATLTTNNVFACTDTSTARTLEISTATISQGSVSRPVYITVKDESGNAATNNITISTENLELIDGVASIDITANYGNLTMYSDGVNLYIVSP